MDGQTVLTDTTYYATNTLATGTNKELNEICVMMKQLEDSVTSQAATVANLSTKMNGCSSGTRKITDKKKARSGLHMCTHCKWEVYHKDRNGLKLETNKANQYPGWKNFFTK